MGDIDTEKPTTINLWACVHDGELLSLSSDLLARTLLLNLHVSYINKFHRLSDDAAFRVVCRLVRSVRAMRHQPWPGESVISREMPWEEQERLRQEIYARGRMESVAWAEVENVIEEHPNGEVMEGELITDENDLLTLMLGIYFRDKEDYLDLFFECEEIKVLTSEDAEISITDLLALGEAYWEARAESKARKLTADSVRE